MLLGRLLGTLKWGIALSFYFGRVLYKARFAASAYNNIAAGGSGEGLKAINEASLWRYLDYLAGDKLKICQLDGIHHQNGSFRTHLRRFCLICKKLNNVDVVWYNVFLTQFY